LMSAQVDEGVQEAQEVLAVALQYEVEMAQEVDRAYSGPKTVLVGWKGSRKPLTYDPKQLWDGAQPMVGYSFPGVSTEGMEIKAGQRIAMQTMSRQRFMEVDPYIEDPDLEKDRIVVEALNDAILTMISTLASTPDGPMQPVQVARIAKLVLSDRMELGPAVTMVHEEAQEAQATPVEPGAPEAQPGLSPPGQGVEQPAAIQGPNTLHQNLGNGMARLRQPEMTVASEQ
ncbi:MAG: hypothetical protein GY701_35375, partial [Sulfitobacter sp.]|nr:hypothetical protein [Sulfitobacter sp.]